jgi:hypothetical protein
VAVSVPFRTARPALLKIESLRGSAPRGYNGD